MNFIVGNVKAIHDIWIIGDQFLRDAMKELSMMTKNAKKNKTDPPYMYKMYNISGYFVGFGTRGIINPVIDALNDNNHLPRIILIVPHQDLLQGTMKSAFVMGSSLHYIVKQLDLVTERRHQDLLHKCIGSLMENYLKTVWVRMLKRSNPDELKAIDSAFGLRGKFNSILEERLLDGRSDEHHIMSIVVQLDHFNNVGNLTDAGKQVFWNSGQGNQKI